MPIPAAHNRVEVTGTLLQQVGGGSEIFSFSWADMSTLALNTIAGIVNAEMQSAFSDPTKSIQASTHAQYLATRVESIDSAGKVTGSYNQAAGGGPYTGLNSSMTCTMTCLCVSLETGQIDSRGNKVRGRFFPPAQAAGLIGATFDSTDMNGYTDAWAASFNRMVTAGLVPAVASSTSVGLVAATGISCANTVDVQRRRKNRVTVFRSHTTAI